MLYIIGLGLNEKSISGEGLEVIKKCKKIYLESYTVTFPYSIRDLEKALGIKLISADREFIESFDVLKDAKKSNVALLVYGSPLTATTHISLLQEAKKQKIRYEVIYSASVLDAIAETGLQLYKFGKITSMPEWQREKHYTPDSFMETLKENRFINAHSLILMDIGLDFRKAVYQLRASAEKYDFKMDRITVCSQLGTRNSKIFYGTIPELKNKKIYAPFCFIIPGEMHFFEREVLEEFKN
jgi:diphthine synthase